MSHADCPLVRTALAVTSLCLWFSGLRRFYASVFICELHV